MRHVRRFGILLLLSVSVAAVLPWSGNAADTLERIGVFGIESEGAARGAWFQAYDGNGVRVLNVFLGEELGEFQLANLQLDGTGTEELTIVGVDPDGRFIKLLVRTRSGKAVASAETLVGQEIIDLQLFEVPAGSDERTRIGIGYQSADGSGSAEVWSLRSGAGTRAPDTLARERVISLVPANSTEITWLSDDLTGDGAPVLIAGYSGRNGRGAYLRVASLASGALLADRRVFGPVVRSRRVRRRRLRADPCRARNPDRCTTAEKRPR